MLHVPPDRAALLALLDFYVEAGVDMAVDEMPHDRLAEPAEVTEPETRHGAAAPFPALERAPRPQRPLQRMETKALPASPDEAAQSARERARNAQDLAELQSLLAAFEGCGLRVTAKSLVFADGNPQGRVMFVGEAPGGEEDRMGKPFVGRSGQLLDRMLAAIGLDRTGVYIANVVPWRPPGNRTPTPQEVAICKPFIEKQIELADPDILVCLGGPSAQTLLSVKDGILKTRGRWFTYPTGRREIRALATLHPAYLLRQPLQKRLAWRDFRALKRALETPV
jgi:DNA polymerase